MKIKQQKITAFIVFSFLMMAFMTGAEKAKKPIYLNPAYSVKEMAADLVSKMSLEEKQSQPGNIMPPILRLGVNQYDVWFYSDATKPDTPFDVSFDYFRINNSGLK